MRQKEQPFHQVSMAIARVSMAANNPELIGKTEEMEAATLMKDAAQALKTLMDFRNIINSMASLKESPVDAARQHIEQSEIE